MLLYGTVRPYQDPVTEHITNYTIRHGKNQYATHPKLHPTGYLPVLKKLRASEEKSTRFS